MEDTGCDHSFNNEGRCEYCGLSEDDFDAGGQTEGTYR
jgi:hypothetical protein